MIDDAKFDMMIRLMEYDYLNNWEQKFVEKMETNYKKYGRISDGQFDKLEEIFDDAASRVEWSR